MPHLSLAVTLIVVLSCEMHLCGDCLSKDTTHPFWISRWCIVCVMYLYACYWECDEIKWFLLASYCYFVCKGMNTEGKIVCLQAWIAWEAGEGPAPTLPAASGVWSGSDAGGWPRPYAVSLICLGAAAHPGCEAYGKVTEDCSVTPGYFWCVELSVDALLM